jgi:rRNA-processing protein FCF1
MENSYLIDTNILVYAYNENVEYHKKSLKIVEDMLNRQMNAVMADKNSLYDPINSNKIPGVS